MTQSQTRRTTSLRQRLRPLHAVGWNVLYDRCDVTGVLIDAIAVGPPGVCVIDLLGDDAVVDLTDPDDTEQASASRQRDALTSDGGATLTVVAERPVRNAPRLFDSLERQVDRVASVVGPQVETLGALASDAAADAPVRSFGRVHIVPAEALAEVLAISRPVHGPRDVAEIARILDVALQGADHRPSKESTAGWYLDHTLTCLRLTIHPVGERTVAYAMAPRQRIVAVRDLAGDAVQTLADGDRSLASYALSGVSTAGFHPDARTMPRVPTSVPAGKYLGPVAAMWRSVAVSHFDPQLGVWAATLLHPIDGVIRLGVFEPDSHAFVPQSSSRLVDGAATAVQLADILVAAGLGPIDVPTPARL